MKRIRRGAARILLALVWLLAGSAAEAHKPSDSYLTLHVQDERIEGQWDIALRDLDLALGLDADQDGAITWGEVRRRHPDIAAYALSRLALSAEGAPCLAAANEHLIDRHSDGAYAVISFSARCARPPSAITATYRLLFDLDPQHRGLVRVDHPAGVRTAIFAPESQTQSFVLAEPSRVHQFAAYLEHGVWHIWRGFDHLLFLLSLLLPAVLVRRGVGWNAGAVFGNASLDVLKVVTAFTLAHSVTLTLAALGVLALPSRLVESAIAISVVLAALNNIYPVVSERRWVLAFVFGLVHGFGFAGVLADLGLPRGALLVSLVAFNLGVEGGQLAVVALFLPPAWWFRDTWAYRRLTLYAGSAGVALLATIWLMERAFDVKVIA